MDAKDVLLASVLAGGGSGGGGSEALIVHVGGTPPNFTVDKTYNEIVEATNNGVSVMLFNPNNEFEGYLTSTSGGVCLFSSFGAFNGAAILGTFSVAPDNTVSYASVQLQE